MSRIKIKNFGPLKETASVTDGWIDIKKVTVFTGNQGSGKSTVAKLVSTFTWMEKVLTRGERIYRLQVQEQVLRLPSYFQLFHKGTD